MSKTTTVLINGKIDTISDSDFELLKSTIEKNPNETIYINSNDWGWDAFIGTDAEERECFEGTDWSCPKCNPAENDDDDGDDSEHDCVTELQGVFSEHTHEIEIIPDETLKTIDDVENAYNINIETLDDIELVVYQMLKNCPNAIKVLGDGRLHLRRVGKLETLNESEDLYNAMRRAGLEYPDSYLRRRETRMKNARFRHENKFLAAAKIINNKLKTAVAESESETAPQKLHELTEEITALQEAGIKIKSEIEKIKSTELEKYAKNSHSLPIWVSDILEKIG